MASLHPNPVTLQEEFENWALLLDQVMNDPALSATPHVAAALDLLGQGLARLAKVVIKLEAQG